MPGAVCAQRALNCGAALHTAASSRFGLNGLAPELRVFKPRAPPPS